MQKNLICEIFLNVLKMKFKSFKIVTICLMIKGMAEFETVVNVPNLLELGLPFQRPLLVLPDQVLDAHHRCRLNKGQKSIKFG
jgi:hypothetical protein